MPSEMLDEKAIFNLARQIGSPDARAEYLRRACGTDSGLRERVQVLLNAYEEQASFLESSPPAGVAPTIEAPVDGVSPIDRPVSESSGTVIGPYKLIEQLGEGGMGSVWMAQQTEPVKRLVALKLIKAGMDTRQVIARFEAERQALALMDHPNIARVLDGGTTEAGRPYFVMDLVKGMPITKYCDEHRLTPRQRLELFLPVCHAIQHAHQKGIIHRDIKPSNVLVAQYDGKPVPKVIDFGVAKAAGQSLTEKTLVTGFGAIVGTLEYMSPEQAEVNQLDIDTRSDIYSLGVLLYELLAGSPPFTKKELEGAGVLEMLRVIREEEPSKPSTKLSTAEGLPTLAANRGTEPAKLTRLVRGELDWIVMKALEKDRNRRYETANGFAMDVQRYLADESVLACPPSVGYRLRKFARRNKGSLAVASVVAGAVLLVVGSIGYMVRDRAAERTQRMTRVASQVEEILQEVERLEKEQKWPEALAAARRAETAVAGGEADDVTRQRVAALLKDLEFIDRLERIRMQYAIPVEEKLDRDGANREYARAFREYGVDVDELPAEMAIARLKARPALVLSLAAALDEWALARRAVFKKDLAPGQRLMAVARGIDPDPLRDELRANYGQPAVNGREALRRLAESIDIHAQHPATLVILARTLGKDGHPDAKLRILRAGQSVHPGDYWLSYELGSALHFQKDYDGAIRFATAAVAIRPSSAHAHSYLGFILRPKKLDEAISAYRKAIELDPKDTLSYLLLGTTLRDELRDYVQSEETLRRATELDPKSADAHLCLGDVLNYQKKWDEAIAAYLKGIELGPKKGAGAHSNLGYCLRMKGRLNGAIDAYHKAIELDPNYDQAHYGLGKALSEQSKWFEAAESYRKAIALNPKLCDAYIGLGCILCDNLRDYVKAEEAFRKATELEPKNALAHNNLGNALYHQRKWDEAIAEYRKAVELDPKCAQYHGGLGNALRMQKNPQEAIAEYRKAVELDPKLARIYRDLGELLHDEMREYGKAEEAFRKAIELKPRDAVAHCYLGSSLCEQGKFPEAIDAYHKAIELDPKSAAAYNHLGYALLQQNKLDEALAAFRSAIELDPKDAYAYFNLGITLKDQKKWDEAVAAFRKGIELDPKERDAYIYLGVILCNNLRDYVQAEEAFRKAIELDPKSAIAHFNLGNALRHQRKWDEAIAAYRKAIELAPKNAGTHYDLGNALKAKGDLDGAELAYREAVRLNGNRHGAAINALAELLLSRGNVKDALATARKAVELAPQSDSALQVLGWALYRAGDWKASIEALEKSCALQANPKGGNAGQWIVLAMAYWQLGEKDKAREWYGRAVAWMDKNQPKNEQLLRFRTEAAQLLELKEKQ